MKEKKLVPKLRFPGFTEPWEQRKLGEIVERVTRKNNGQSDRPLTISAQDGLVDQCEYFDRQVASRDMSNYYLIKKGEFAYNKSYSDGYPFGAIKRLDYYDKGALSTLYIIFKIVDDRIGSDFMVAYYMTSLWHKEISKRAAEGARNHGLLNISTEDFFTSELKIPNDIKEQIKVGKFVNQFDQYITLHQRKLEHLKLKKKSLLQKLFPKEGEVYPELRFPGFTEPWEQRKLGDLYKRINERNDGTLGRNKWISVAKMYFQDPEKVQSNNLDTRTYVMKKGDIAFEGHPNNEFKFGRFVLNDIGTGIISELFPIYRPITEYDLNFWKYAIQFERVMAPIFAKSITSSGNSSNKLDQNHFLNQTILVPPISEQKEIGAILERTTNLITLHQRKLEHLQLLKKALLQQLFV